MGKKFLLAMFFAFVGILNSDLFAQNKTIPAVQSRRTITGTVITNAGKQPVSGASVVVPGSRSGKISDGSGQFVLSVASDATVIVVSAVGFLSDTVSLGNADDYTVLLKTTEEALSDVVVTVAGGLKTKERAQGYNSTLVSGASITTGKPVSPAAGLQGKVPGLLISGTTGGVNPDYRIILRGQRSLTGNNQALVVLDNVVVPNSFLGNLNPEDIESINVLNGGAASALYGSAASNGALIVTTKKGKAGITEIKLSNTLTAQHVAFFPKLQTTYGGGGNGYGIDANGDPAFSYLENQSYGPRYNGQLIQLGDPLQDGSVQMVPYSPNDSREKFWKTGIQNQTDFSLSQGDDRSTFFLSGQYVSVTGTTPGDKYNRAAIRLTGTRKLFDNLTAAYSLSYTQNRYDITTQTANMYNDMLNVPGNVPLTNYANWQTDPFANPNGFYNPWYLNPYFAAANYRQKVRNDVLVGNIQMDYNPLKWLGFTYRIGVSTNNSSNKQTVGAFTYSSYANSVYGSTKANISGQVNDGMSYWTTLNSELQAHINTKVKDFGFSLDLGFPVQQNNSKNMATEGDGLVVNGVYNLTNATSFPTPPASEANYMYRSMAVYGDFKASYKNWLFLEVTGRNDWVSTLSPKNRSFFYPAFDLSFVATDAIKALKNISWLDYLKLRGGWAKSGQVNLGNATNWGAYFLFPGYSQINGFPYNGVPGFTVGNQLVDNNLKPEMTNGWEAGVDVNVFKDFANIKATYYSTKTDNQTLPVRISAATGYATDLMNTGLVSNKGWELALTLNPVKTKDFEVNFAANYTYTNSMVVSINSTLPSLLLAGYTDGTGSYAVPGHTFPVIMGYDYSRDPQGRIVVDSHTGIPLVDDTVKILGNANPKNILGLNPQIRFKNFRLSATFEYRGGYKIWNQGGSSLDWSGVSTRTTVFNRERFVVPNSVYVDANGNYVPNTNITVSDGNDGFWASQSVNMNVTSNYVTSGDFWKLRELAVSYDLPAKLVSRTGFIKSATVSLQGRNLFVWLPKSNLYTDPEYSAAGTTSNGIGFTSLGQTPPSRYYGGTITVTF